MLNKKLQVDITTERLRIVIDESKMTREKIANEIGVDTSTVTKYYTGDRKLTYDAMKKFAILFDVSTDYLMGLTSVKTSDKDLKFVCDYTGLDEVTVINLKNNINENTKISKFINKFINDFLEMKF